MGIDSEAKKYLADAAEGAFSIKVDRDTDFYEKYMYQPLRHGKEPKLRPGFSFAMDGSAVIESRLGSQYSIYKKSKDDKPTSISGHSLLASVKDEIERALRVRGCSGVHFVIDTNGPTKNRAKDIAYKKRRASIQASNWDFRDVKISEFSIPAGDEWKAFKMNPYLARQINWFFYDRLLNATDMRFYEHSDPQEDEVMDQQSKYLLFDGGVSYSDLRSEDLVVQYKSFKKTIRRNEDVTRGVIEEVPSADIPEGELAAKYHIMKDLSRDWVYYATDGDTLLISLLACRDRIDKKTGKFKNKVFIRMRPPGGAKKNSITFVDVNMMYEELIAYCKKTMPNVKYPIETMCLLAIIGGTDFFDHEFCSGIGYGTMVSAFEAQLRTTPGLIYRDDSFKLRINQTETIFARNIVVDLATFVKCTHACYLAKYPGKTLQTMRKTLSAKNAPPDDCVFEAYARNAMHNMLYWANEYYFRLQRQDHIVYFDCLEQINGLPLWGYELIDDPDRPGHKRVARANRVYGGSEPSTKSTASKPAQLPSSTKKLPPPSETRSKKQQDVSASPSAKKTATTNNDAKKKTTVMKSNSTAISIKMESKERFISHVPRGETLVITGETNVGVCEGTVIQFF